MEPYKRRDAEKLYNDLLQQVHQQMISYREITNNKLSMIEEMLESLVQEVKVDSMVKEENEHEEFMNPIVSKEWNTRSLSHLQIMFPKLEGAEVIKCSPDSEQQEFTGNPIYDEEPGEGQECWPEKEFILAALNGRNPKSSKLVQPEICTSERPEASEELSYTQVTQNRKIIAREMIRENPKKNGDNLFEVKKLDLSHEWEDECPVDDCVHDTYKEDLEGIDLAYDSRMVFTFGVFPRVKMKFTVLLVVIALNRSNGIGGSDHGNEKGLKGFSIDSLMDGVSEVVSNTTAAAAIERVTLLIQNQYESSNYEEVEQNTPLSAILKPSPKATLSEQGPLCGNGSSGDMGIAEFLDLILACSNESPWNILAELPTSAPNILTWLEQAYCESIGYEYIHLADRTQYNWLRDKIETPTPMQYNRQRREVILDRLIWSIQFENFLATKWTAAKRFGLEGDETLIHGIKEMFDRSADLGVKSIVIGMSHRGRLNVLGNVARKPLGQIFYEFINGTKPVDEVGLYTGTEDVKYHLGTSYDWPTRGGKRIQLSLDANPSHLEAVDPLVVGKTRAKQYYSNDVDMTNNMGILIHGDGSFAGQGVEYETLHLSALPNYTTEETKDILLLDVAPLALGIETVGGVMTKKCQTFTTYQDQQTPISIQVFEGERSLTKNCRLPGKFDLPGIAPAPRETPRIEVTFEVDAKGILNIKAEDKASCKSEKITITNDNGRPSQEEIERMVQEAGEFAEEDKKIKEKIDARNRLETYIYNMKNQINDKDKLADKLESDEKEKIDTAVKKALEWLDDNQSAEKKDYDEKLKEVEAVCNPIITAVTIFDPGGRKWSHEINHEDMVVFQGGRIVRKCRYLGLINNYYKGIEYVEYALVIRSCCVLTYKVVLQRHSCNMYDGRMLSWKHGIVLCRCVQMGWQSRIHARW